MKTILDSKKPLGIGVEGIISVLVGAIILSCPSRTTFTVTLCISVAFVLIGLDHLFTSCYQKSVNNRGNLLLAVLYIAIGGFALPHLDVARHYYSIFLGLLIGSVWLIEGIIRLQLIKLLAVKRWEYMIVCLNIIAGLSLLLSPICGMKLLLTILGYVLFIVGILKIIEYFLWEKIEGGDR